MPGSADRRACPECGENIARQARICRFCRHTLTAAETRAERAATNPRALLNTDEWDELRSAAATAYWMVRFADPSGQHTETEAARILLADAANTPGQLARELMNSLASDLERLAATASQARSTEAALERFGRARAILEKVDPAEATLVKGAIMRLVLVVAQADGPVRVAPLEILFGEQIAALLGYDHDEFERARLSLSVRQ